MAAIELMYVGWYMPLIMLYMALIFAYLVFRVLGGGRVLDSRISAPIALMVIAACGVFYFLLPVPGSVQQKMKDSIVFLKDNNGNPELKSLQLALSVKCEKKYLNAIDYFQIKDAYLKDFEEVFEKNKMVNLGIIEIGEIYKKSAGRLCDIKNKI